MANKEQTTTPTTEPAGDMSQQEAIAECIRSQREAEELRKRRQEAELLAMMQEQHRRIMAQEQPTEEDMLLKQNIAMADRVIKMACREMERQAQAANDLANEKVYALHSRLLLHIANRVVLAHQNRAFVIDEYNKDILRFMLYYFNGCPLAEEVFPERGYKLHKNLMLCGEVGAGKTLLMQVFSEYLRYTNNPRQFYNLSVTQMVNYYTLHNNLDRYTFNEEENKGFLCTPVNVCLNDIGVESITFYGMDTKLLTNQFLHARNEIWVNYHKYAHVTTNLTKAQLEKEFADGFGRLLDRFKTYNIIPVGGKSRR